MVYPDDPLYKNMTRVAYQYNLYRDSRLVSHYHMALRCVEQQIIERDGSLYVYDQWKERNKGQLNCVPTTVYGTFDMYVSSCRRSKLFYVSPFYALS